MSVQTMPWYESAAAFCAFVGVFILSFTVSFLYYWTFSHARYSDADT